MTELILVIMVIYVTMVYGPIAAFLVELFPTKIRYTSMSLPYHIGAGWFGGMLPLLATAIVASTGNIYNGLWYPIVVAVMTTVIGGLFLRDTKDVDIMVGSGVEAALAAALSALEAGEILGYRKRRSHVLAARWAGTWTRRARARAPTTPDANSSMATRRRGLVEDADLRAPPP